MSGCQRGRAMIKFYTDALWFNDPSFTKLVLTPKNILVPRCECVSQNDCQRGWTCEDCECVRKPDIDGVIGCDPDFDECSERKSILIFIHSVSNNITISFMITHWYANKCFVLAL